MKQTIQLKDSRKINVDSDLLTVRKRKEIRTKFPLPEETVEDNPKVLAELEIQFKTTPPTQKDIYKGYLKLLKPADKNNDEEFFEEVFRVCCRWVDDKEVIGDVLTEDEFQELPYDLPNYIRENFFTDSVKSFLVITPAKTS